MEWNSWTENNTSAVFWKVWKSSRMQTNWRFSSWRIPWSRKHFWLTVLYLYKVYSCTHNFILCFHFATIFESQDITKQLLVVIPSVKESWSPPQDSGDMRHFALSTPILPNSTTASSGMCTTYPSGQCPLWRLELPARGCEQLCRAHTGKLPFPYVRSPGCMGLPVWNNNMWESYHFRTIWSQQVCTTMKIELSCI